jgi:hypothetical protein
VRAKIKIVLPCAVSLGNEIPKAPLLVLQLRATQELSPVGKGTVEDLKTRILNPEIRQKITRKSLRLDWSYPTKKVLNARHNVRLSTK